MLGLFIATVAAGVCQDFPIAATDGICSETVMGVIPSIDKMPSALIKSPANRARLTGAFKITVETKNFNPFQQVANPIQGYLSQPQSLGLNGLINGAIQVVIQHIPDPSKAPPAESISFFQIMSTNEVIVPANSIPTKGLHRICTMLGAQSLQPVVMPVAKRGSQDDCIRVFIQ